MLYDNLDLFGYRTENKPYTVVKSVSMIITITSIDRDLNLNTEIKIDIITTEQDTDYK